MQANKSEANDEIRRSHLKIIMMMADSGKSSVDIWKIDEKLSIDIFSE